MPAPLYGSPSPYPHSPAAFSTHNFKFRQEEMKAELLSTDTGIVLCADVWKRVYFPVSKAEGRQTVVIVEKVLFLFVEFEIIVGTADWMDAENTGIQTDGYGFPGKVEPDSRPTFFGIQFSFHCIPVFSYPLQFHVPDKFKSVSLYFSPHMLYAGYDALFHFPALPDILHTISLSKDFHGIFSGS